MKLFTLTLLIGWVAWFLCGFLMVEFPNARWNHSVAGIVFALGIGLVLATLVFCALLVVRLISRVSMKILGQILLVWWVLSLFGAFLVIEFPHAGWNHAATETVWGLSISVTLVTLGVCLALVFRPAFGPARPLAQGSGYGPLPTVYSKNNWSRGWVIGLVAFFAAAMFVAALLGIVEHQMKSSPVYAASVAQARGSATVLESLGEPVVAGWLVSGELTESSDGGGNATLTIPLRGPKGNGTLRVAAGRRAGDWHLSTLQFVSGGHGSTTDLLVKRIE